MEELILVSILKLGPLNSFVSTFIEGVPKSTVYCIGLVNSSIILKDVFSVILLGNGSYNFIKNVGSSSFSCIKLTPVSTILLPKFIAKSLK